MSCVASTVLCNRSLSGDTSLPCPLRSHRVCPDPFVQVDLRKVKASGAGPLVKQLTGFVQDNECGGDPIDWSQLRQEVADPPPAAVYTGGQTASLPAKAKVKVRCHRRTSR